MTYKFKMSGGLGDVIFALPTMRALGGGSLCICPSVYTENCLHACSAGPAAQSMFTQVRTLLLAATDYVDQVDVCTEEQPAAYDLNRFRLHGNLAGPPNLAVMILETFELNPAEAKRSWLDLPAMRPQGVIIHRTGRYHAPDFPWGQLVEKYSIGSEVMFVGTLAEHQDFCAQSGAWIPWRFTPDLLSLAMHINASELFCGNQSVGYAIAEGLKHRAVLELVHQNNNFERDSVTINPTVEQLPNL